MMLVPRDDFDLFDNVFDDPFFSNRKHNNFNQIMKTDIKDNKDNYEVLMDLPGYTKDNIEINVENGYLNIHAKIEKNDEDKEENKFVRRERYCGECSRSFYLGDDVKQDDIKASFNNGTLSITVPKKDPKEELSNKTTIEIE